MNFIKSFLEELNPQIIVKHFQTSEETKEGQLNHEFVCFDASNIVINSILSAKILAKKMGTKVFPFLENLAHNTKDKKKSEIILKTKDWVYKKAVWHPALVEKCAHKTLKKMQSDGMIYSIPLSYKEIYTDVSIAAVLHDIGRLSEVDIAQGGVIPKSYGLNKNHAEISFDILKHAKIKPEILLAIKYHYFADIKEATEDDIYIKLNDEKKKVARFYARILQDMDKAGNLVERSKFGLRKSSEYFSAQYIKDYNLTSEYYDIAMSGLYLPITKGYLLDAMVHYVTMVYDTHYKETKEILSSVLSNFFLQIYDEIWEEYNDSQDKNKERLADVLEKIAMLEDFAMTEKIGMNTNKCNRQKILKQIAELRKDSGNA